MNLIGPSYNLESRPASVQRTINMVPVPLEAGNERTAFVFKDVPGLVSAVSEWDTEPPPAPVIETQTAANLAFATSWSIAAPLGIEVGDLLLVLVTAYAGGQEPNTSSTGWTRLHSYENTSGGTLKSALFAKIATGTDALSASVNPASNTFASYCYWRISGASSTDGVVWAISENGATSATVAFAELESGFGLVEKLWLSAFAWHGTAGITVNAFPSGYDSTQSSAPVAGTNRTASASAAKTSTLPDETPGDVTLSAAKSNSQSWTIGIKG